MVFEMQWFIIIFTYNLILTLVFATYSRFEIEVFFFLTVVS